MIQAAVDCVHWRQQTHVLIVAVVEWKHYLGEFQLLVTPGLALVGDLQEDSVDATPGNHQIPTGVSEASKTFGVPQAVLPLKVFTISDVVKWS